MSDAAHDEAVPRRYVVGIDLGTTNCAVALVDTEASPWQVETYPVLQRVDWGQIERRDTLPSFHYQMTEAEREAASGTLPWEEGQPEECVGVLARDAGMRVPGRRIQSAKSWLCHEGVDRTAKLLPWHGDPDVTKLSPVEAASRYLGHIRECWDRDHPEYPLAAQDVIVTLPASFDEVARELTVEAARVAGLARIYLIEEPQAAFYAWIDRHRDDWAERVRTGQLILVCDIGGGTTDFTLIRVLPAAGEGTVQFHRVAVGRHLILGGDNLDLALAHAAEGKLGGGRLPPRSWDRLLQACRVAKESMLSDQRPAGYTINLPPEGTRLIGGGTRIELTAEEVDRVLVDGFFPRVELGERPRNVQSGFQEFGLPYASDPAITRHLASFLSDHRRAGLEEGQEGAQRPELVLFNGGVMVARRLRDPLVDSLVRWFAEGGDDDWRPEVLQSERLDLAVARGAAYFGMVRRGEGVRIAANLGRSYYIQVSEDPPEAMCLIPGRAEPGDRYAPQGHDLRLQIGQPVQFPLWASSTRLADAAGQIIPIDREQLTALPPIATALVHGKRRREEQLSVGLEAELSEIGTLGLFCVDRQSNRRWQLHFDIRSTLETDRTAHAGAGEAAGIVDISTLDACREVITEVFGANRRASPEGIVRRLQSAAGSNRRQWPPSLLRELWQVLFDHQSGRRRSPAHEARWLNLAGYCLRPGYGVAVDDWRVSQMWRSVHGKLAHPAAASRTESLILWRRIAGGLTLGQQRQLAEPLSGALRSGKGKLGPHELPEAWRLIGALELLPMTLKTELADVALEHARRGAMQAVRPALLWAVGRIGTRQPAYGPLNQVVPPECAAGWLDRLRTFDAGDRTVRLAAMQLARRTGDRYRDIDQATRDATADWMAAAGADDHLVRLVREGGQLEGEEETAVFGEALPLGIRLVR